MRNQKKFREQEKIDHVKACLEWVKHGKSINSYAVTNGIIGRTLYDWMNKYSKQIEITSEPVLMKIEKPEQKQEAERCITSSLRVLVGSFAIELPAGHGDHDLKRVVAALKEVN